MVRTIIIDDEQHCKDRLLRLIEGNCSRSLQVEGTFHSVEEGIKAIKELKPGLVFLDIQIHEKTGFDLLQALPEIDFEVIFTTGFEKYAIQAFKFSAVDYLLKPVDADDLIQAVSRLEKRLSSRDISAKFETLIHNLKNQDKSTKKITVPTSDGLMFIPVNEIIRCQSNVNYTTLYLVNNKKITVAKTLKEFELLLSDYDFFRIHNSHLVNLAFIAGYKKGKGGMVVMSDRSEIEVSTRRKEEFLKLLSS